MDRTEALRVTQAAATPCPWCGCERFTLVRVDPRAWVCLTCATVADQVAASAAAQ